MFFLRRGQLFIYYAESALSFSPSFTSSLPSPLSLPLPSFFLALFSFLIFSYGGTSDKLLIFNLLYNGSLRQCLLTIIPISEAVSALRYTGIKLEWKCFPFQFCLWQHKHFVINWQIEMSKENNKLAPHFNLTLFWTEYPSVLGWNISSNIFCS